MAKDLLRRRLARMVVEGRHGPSEDITYGDVARWIGQHSSLLHFVIKGRAPISDEVQIRLTQFFNLLDGGHIRLVVDERKKVWVRVKMNPQPAKQPMPRIDFTTMKLSYD